MQFINSILSPNQACPKECPEFLKRLRREYPREEQWDRYVGGKLHEIRTIERELQMEAQALEMSKATTVSSLGALSSPGIQFPTSTAPSSLHAYSSMAATAGLNLELNRYMDILPYDRTRVHLSEEASRLTSLVSPVLQGRVSDYINASWVSFPGRWWIATQAPLPHSLDRFWYMVSDQDIKIIVNLTPSIEKGHVKAHPYWPTEDNPILEYEGGLMVHHISSSPFPRAPKDITVRNLKIIRPIYPTTPTIPPSSPLRASMTRGMQGDTKQGEDGSMYEERLITVLHYHTWPDHGVPKEPANSVLHLLDELEVLSPAETVSKSPEEILTPPILVHCSAGCGRTGTLCVLDAILRLLRSPQSNEAVEEMKNLDPIVSLVERARAARPQMVQSVTQLHFIYNVVKDYYTSPRDTFSE
ncbi:protein-tyrosine phosphatase-like protein [Piptocephalis cylindrospora]|uniref:Protein-tyrosine phosphatase-like protein n=1 Tax=Piptocephalis cylindrospora TaxID=1907219 RepID=A0A4P9Y8I4_9FUNG|nr:protein-tyrosine phosphatase-like protein [Piptocephalis cylindrospora]|eukprot:RKP15486.1 protein-tyrosine phosphatase-like protein [Piptocephalis cylindrospora]